MAHLESDQADFTAEPLKSPSAAGPFRPHGLVDQAAEAALSLAADRRWDQISLREIALAAGAPLADLYAATPGKIALLDHLSRSLDARALASAEADTSAETIDRLFEAVMARLEAMEPHRTALISIARSEGLLALAPRLPRTAKALLEAAGIDTGGVRGALRLAAMTGVWTRVLQVWRDDEGALNRTMAEIDTQLKQINQRLSRLGAGF
jgi:AcrR family transcriptional regulator